jgi:hypothetical protein
MMSGRDAATVCRQMVALDRLTVLRLRTECRSRRLPVSGRKRNLVRRLLPFADVILQPSDYASTLTTTPAADGCVFNTASAATSTPACLSVVDHSNCRPLVTHPDAGGRFERQPVDEPNQFVRSHNGRQHSPTGVSGAHLARCQNGNGFSDCGGEQGTCDLASRCPAIDNAVSLVAADVETVRGSDAALPFPLRDASDGTLTDCWLRQQRLIDTLRRQLVRYRMALSRVKCVRSTDGGANGVQDALDDDATRGFLLPAGCETIEEELAAFGPITFKEEQSRFECHSSISLECSTTW